MKKIKIISGGQTGVDQAALDVALELGLEIGGWVPKGAFNENGEYLLDKYPQLKETPSDDPKQRTEWNVRDSDWSIIFYPWLHEVSKGTLESKGTDYTIEVVNSKNQSHSYVLNRDLYDPTYQRGEVPPQAVVEHTDLLELDNNSIKPLVINVAGPRESELPGVYEKTKELLKEILEDLMREGRL